MIVGPAGVASRAASASPPTVISSPTAQPPATIAGRLRKRRSATSGGMASKRDREHDPDQGEERDHRKCHDQQQHERQGAHRQPLELGVLVVEGGRHELAAEQQQTLRSWRRPGRRGRRDPATSPGPDRRTGSPRRPCRHAPYPRAAACRPPCRPPRARRSPHPGERGVRGAEVREPRRRRPRPRRRRAAGRSREASRDPLHRRRRARCRRRGRRAGAAPPPCRRSRRGGSRAWPPRAPRA